MTIPTLAGKRVLLMTVGVGDLDKLEQTLFTPLRKSIQSGEWDLIVLLPSQVTVERAEQLKQQLDGTPFQIHPLPVPGAENDADASFAHFDSVIRSLIQQGCDPHSIVADFTRGTKAMSAALVLAATAAELPQLRYIHGPRDQRGTVLPGQEQIGNFATARVTARQTIREAVRLLRSLQFTAASSLAASAASANVPSYRAETEWLQWLAGIWGAWDRFDFAEVVRLSQSQPSEPVPAPLAHWCPSPAQLDHAERLARPLPDDIKSRAVELRALVADMLENGRRRIQLGHLEDASLRAYRVVELFGQTRLSLHGYDTAAIPPDDPTFQAYLDQQRRKKGDHFSFPSVDRKGRYLLPRLQTASFLRYLRDPLANVLCDPKKHLGFDPDDRNHSNLIHGFTARTRTAAAKELRDRYQRLEEYWRDESPSNARLFALSRFPFPVD